MLSLKAHVQIRRAMYHCPFVPYEYLLRGGDPAPFRGEAIYNTKELHRASSALYREAAIYARDLDEFLAMTEAADTLRALACATLATLPRAANPFR